MRTNALDKKMLQDFQIIRIALHNDLISNYSRAFNLAYQPGFFDNAQRFQQLKKPIAKSLFHYAAVAKLEDLYQIVYFISQYEADVADNCAQDPAGLIGKLHGKKDGGSLGVLLATHKKKIQVFKDDVDNYLMASQESLNLMLDVLHHGLSMLEEKGEGYFYIGQLGDSVPSPAFHLSKLKSIKEKEGARNFDLEVLIDRLISQTSDSSESNRQCNVENIKKEIARCRKQQMRLDLASFVSDKDFLNLTPNKKIAFLMMHEIINHFIRGLQSLERQCTWRWHIHVLNGHLTQEPQTVKNRKIVHLSQGDLAHQTWRYYMRDTLNFLDVHDLFENEELAGYLSNVMNDFKTAHENPAAEVTNEIFNHLDGLNELKKLEQHLDWGILWKFDHTKWKDVLCAFVETELREPLNALYAWSHDPQKPFQCNHGDLLPLFETATRMVNDLEKLERFSAKKIVAERDACAATLSPRVG